MVFFTLMVSCRNQPNDEKLPEQQEQMLLKMAQSYFTPLSKPDFENISPERKKIIELGRKLFYEKKISGDQKINCANCHNIADYGASNKTVTPGSNGLMGFRNAPSVINAHLQFALNWDAKYNNLEDQLSGMFFSKTEMGLQDSTQLIGRLKIDSEYTALFREAFPQSSASLSMVNVRKAIASFLRTLTSPGRFDDYLRGDTEALNYKEKIGIKSFIENGCVPCHSTALVGGGMAQKFALFGYYWDYTNSKKIDKGRYEITKKPEDEYIFKVPQLRNVEKTFPYMHDGSVQSLEEAVKIMAMTESNRQLDEKDVENIVAFLRSLTGYIPEHGKEKRN
ncbi:MAG: cytochrome-c peroxidase [Deltaproteobacteria bacterium]